MKYYTHFLESSGISTDTRAISKDCMFISLKGTNFNGNTFAKKAIENGAKYAIVDEEEFADNKNIFHVENALVFLQKLANHHRKQFDIPVIGITGSNGKTTSKELIREVLAPSYSVLATKGNLNNHIGVPLTLLQLTKEHEIAIIEMGANKANDIQELCEIAEPNHGIITNIGSAHLEGFINFEGVLKTKKELYDWIESVNGQLFINNDDQILTDVLPENIHVRSYGANADANLNGELLQLKPEVEFKYSIEEYNSEKLTTQIIGKYNFYNFLAALCIGDFFRVPFEKMEKAITEYIPDNNRSQIKKTDSNTLIMDAYNANPTSVKSAVESFAMIDNSNKLFILGDMLELGQESKKLHQEIIDLTIDLNLKGYFVGPIYSECTGANFFTSKEELQHFIKENKIKDSLILLKGSRGIGLESLVSEL